MKSILKGTFPAMVLLLGLSSHARAACSFGDTIYPQTTWYPTGNDCIENTYLGTYVRMVFQTDDNLVAYDYYNKPHWAANTPNYNCCSLELDLQEDGNWVMYVSGFLWSNVVWASNTAYNEYGGSEANEFSWVVAQTDGNVVLYSYNPDGDGFPRWDIFHHGYF